MDYAPTMELALASQDGGRLLALPVAPRQQVLGAGFVHDECEPLLALYQDGCYLTLARSSTLLALAGGWRAASQVELSADELARLQSWINTQNRTELSRLLRLSPLAS